MDVRLCDAEGVGVKKGREEGWKDGSRGRKTMKRGGMVRRARCCVWIENGVVR